MHEHISDELVDMEVLRHEEMKTTQTVEVCDAHLSEHKHGHEGEDVYDKQVAGNNGYSKHCCDEI